MGTYKKILVATDGSEFSQEAVKRALALAKENSAEVTAIYVASTQRAWILKEALSQEAKRILAQAKEFADREGVLLNTRIDEGYPFEEIIKVAKEINSDLIIMGSHGRTGMGKILVGSVTERVIGGAPCPVLVVQKER